MRILIAPDKFKHSLGAKEVAEAIASGLRDLLPDAELDLRPLADGGEGTARVIGDAAKGEWHHCEVRDALGKLVRANYCTIRRGEVAVMEMSEAAGLWRMAPDEREVMRASSYGVGEMLLAGALLGSMEIVVGLGGSATNDGGVGMARALGFKFRDEQEREIGGAVSGLQKLARIEKPRTWRLPRITAAADVSNHLLGEHGATRVFGPQKGARQDELEILEASLTRLAEIAARDFGVDHRDASGAGAAGGLGFGMMSFCQATIRSGFEVVAECIGLEAAVRAADIVLTGEGRLDAQTLAGKAPAGVAKLARKFGKRCFAVVGEIEEAKTMPEFFDRVFPLVRAGTSRSEALANPTNLLRARAREIAALLQA